MKKAAALVFLLFVPLSFWAQSWAPVFTLEDIVERQVAEELRRTRRYTRTVYREKLVAPQLFPKTVLGYHARSVWKQPAPPAFVGELFFLFSKENPENDMERAGRVIRSISTMQGIKYYSNSRRRIETLYSDCYMIDNPVDRNRIPDVTNAVEGAEYYFYQKEATLGKCVYGLDFSQGAMELAITYTNIDPIKYGLLTGVKEKNLTNYILVADVGTDLLVYVLVQSYFPASSLIEKRLVRAFLSRAEAVAGWFNDEYKKGGG